MKIVADLCLSCSQCVDYCPVGAIGWSEHDGIFIDEDECVECGCCLRAEVCPCDALCQDTLQWPRVLRAQFSDPSVSHPHTGEGGRGTQEIKTNDVTGRYVRGEIGIAVELGRPNCGARMRDLEAVAVAVAREGVVFQKGNPVYALFRDPARGTLLPEVRNEKVLSAILEFTTTVDHLAAVLNSLTSISRQVETVFCVNMSTVLDADTIPVAEEVVREAGCTIRPNCKNNIGMGRPIRHIR